MESDAVSDAAAGTEAVVLPQFPLANVLLPTMMLSLQVFEPRYREMVAELSRAAPEFGVVLIERGSEVGGGDVRTDVGTRARVRRIQRAPDGRYGVLAVGTERFRVLRWLDDDPYPRAEIVPLDDDLLRHEPSAATVSSMFDQLDRCHDLLRRRGHELGPRPAWSTDPAVASFQVTTMSPLGQHDRNRVLRVTDVAERVQLVAELLADAADALAFGLQD